MISKYITLPLSEAFYRIEKMFALRNGNASKLHGFQKYIRISYINEKVTFLCERSYGLWEYYSEKAIIGFVTSSGGPLKT